MGLWVVGLVLALALPAGAYDDIIGVRYVRCSDGDSCTVTIDHLPDVFGDRITVRLRGIDAPEKQGRCPRELGLAEQARVKLSSLLQSATVLALTDVHRDKYFRLNATIIADGLDVGALLLEQGYAVPYTGKGPRHNWCR